MSESNEPSKPKDVVVPGEDSTEDNDTPTSSNNPEPALASSDASSASPTKTDSSHSTAREVDVENNNVVASGGSSSDGKLPVPQQAEEDTSTLASEGAYLVRKPDTEVSNVNADAPVSTELGDDIALKKSIGVDDYDAIKTVKDISVPQSSNPAGVLLETSQVDDSCIAPEVKVPSKGCIDDATDHPVSAKNPDPIESTVDITESVQATVGSQAVPKANKVSISNQDLALNEGIVEAEPSGEGNDVADSSAKDVRVPEDENLVQDCAPEDVSPSDTETKTPDVLEKTADEPQPVELPETEKVEESAPKSSTTEQMETSEPVQEKVPEDPSFKKSSRNAKGRVEDIKSEFSATPESPKRRSARLQSLQRTHSESPSPKKERKGVRSLTLERVPSNEKVGSRTPRGKARVGSTSSNSELEGSGDEGARSKRASRRDSKK